jgi:hypothetical protein
VRVIVVPTTPLVGDLEREEVTVKVAVGEFVPSLACIVWLPRVLEGTANTILKVPVLEVVALPTCVVKSQYIMTCLFMRKPDPVTVTEEPTLPLMGERVIV